jgi:hypothetical protein
VNETCFDPAGPGVSSACSGVSCLRQGDTEIGRSITKIQVVSSKDEIAQLNQRERVVHLVAPPTATVILELIDRCPQLEAIEVHPSQFERLSTPSLCLLKCQGVKIFPGRIWGHRTDRSEYFTVDEGLIMQKAAELRAEGLDSEEIVGRVGSATGVSPGLVSVILQRYGG